MTGAQSRISFDRFDGGVDTRKGLASSDANRLRRLENAYVTTGRQIRTRPGSVLEAELPPDARGLVALDGRLYSFSTVKNAQPVTGDVNILNVSVPQNWTLDSIHFCELFNSAPYVVAKYTNGEYRHHYFDEAPVWYPSQEVRHGDVIKPAGVLSRFRADVRLQTQTGTSPFKNSPSNSPVADNEVIWYPVDTQSAQKYGLTAQYNPGDVVYVDHPKSIKTMGYRVIQAGQADAESNDDVKWDIVPITDGSVIWQAIGPHSGGFTRQPGGIYQVGDIVSVPREVTEPQRAYYRATPAHSVITGTVEPAWPSNYLDEVSDGPFIVWVAVGSDFSEGAVVADSNCPHTPIIGIYASKIFAVSKDGEAILFSATNNPRDWSTANDAGFLPTGLQMPGSRRITALGKYLTFLAAFSEDSIQTWAVDPDPANIRLDKIVYNIGTPYAGGVVNISGDVFFAASYGVRSISTQQYTENIADTDVGSPVDDLFKDMRERNTDVDPQSIFYQAGGQYMLLFGHEMLVYTFSRVSKVAAWSHYIFNEKIDAMTEFAGNLYIKMGVKVLKVTKDADTDNGIPIKAYAYFPYLHMKSPGEQKGFSGLDIICDGDIKLKFGHDARAPDIETPAIPLSGITRPGALIPLGMMAESLAPRFDMTGKCQIDEFTLYFNRYGVR